MVEIAGRKQLPIDQCRQNPDVGGIPLKTEAESKDLRLIGHLSAVVYCSFVPDR